MVSHIEYLVKPFHDSKNLPIDGCAAMEVPPFAQNPFDTVVAELARQGITAEEYLNRVMERWKERIDAVSKTADSLFVMIDILRSDAVRPIQLIEIRQHAVHRLGGRFVSLCSGYETANYLNTRRDLEHTLKIHAYGEISDRCAIGETNELTRNLKLLRPTIQVTTNFQACLCPDSILLLLR